MLTIRNRHQVHAAKFTTVVAAHKTVSRTFAFNFVASTSIVRVEVIVDKKSLKTQHVSPSDVSTTAGEQSAK